MTLIEVFADIVCPFTHTGLARLITERTRRGAEIQLRVRAWPLEYVNGEPTPPELVTEEVAALRQSVAGDLFTNFDAEQFPRSSILPFGLAESAYERSPRIGESVSIALRRALFEEGRNPADLATLHDIARDWDLDMPSQEMAEATARRDFAEGAERGVRGSPHFFVGGSSWFCPVLEISRDEAGHLHVGPGVETQEQFFEAIFAGG